MQTNDIDFSNKTCKQLIDICKEKKIKGYSGKKKDELIKMLLDNNTTTNEQTLNKEIVNVKH